MLLDLAIWTGGTFRVLAQMTGEECSHLRLTWRAEIGDLAYGMCVDQAADVIKATGESEFDTLLTHAHYSLERVVKGRSRMEAYLEETKAAMGQPFGARNP